MWLDDELVNSTAKTTEVHMHFGVCKNFRSLPRNFSEVLAYPNLFMH